MAPASFPPPRTTARATGRLGVAAASTALFTYGTLMFPEVLAVLLGRVPASVPASVDGWRVLAIPGVSYPALVVAPGRARGRVLLDLRPEEWRVIDAYEDDIYELRPIGSQPGGLPTVAYVCPTTDGVADVDWDADRFAAEELTDYARRCARWRADSFADGVPGSLG